MPSWQRSKEPCPACANPKHKFYIAPDGAGGFCHHCQIYTKLDHIVEGQELDFSAEASRNRDWGLTKIVEGQERKNLMAQGALSPFRGKLPLMAPYSNLARINKTMYDYVSSHIAKSDPVMMGLFKTYGCGVTPGDLAGNPILQNRFIYPIFNKGTLEGYQARALFDTQEPKYWHPYKPIMGILPCLQGSALPVSYFLDKTAPFVLTEGIKDCMRLSVLCDAGALMGHAITAEQLIFLEQEVGRRPLFVGLDENESDNTAKIVDMLKTYGFEAYPLDIEKYTVLKDFGDFHDMVRLREMLKDAGVTK